MFGLTKEMTDKQGWAESFGWLRRPELDGFDYDAWEAPNGALYGFLMKNHDPWLLNGEIVNGQYKVYKTKVKKETK